MTARVEIAASNARTATGNATTQRGRRAGTARAHEVATPTPSAKVWASNPIPQEPIPIGHF